MDEKTELEENKLVGKMGRPCFHDALRKLINEYSMENGSNTPDFILANYLMGCLNNFNEVVRHRDQVSYYGRLEYLYGNDPDVYKAVKIAEEKLNKAVVKATYGEIDG